MNKTTISKFKFSTYTRSIKSLFNENKSIEVTVTNNDHVIAKWINNNLNNNIKNNNININSLNFNEYFTRQAIGFDIEWRAKFIPNKRNGNRVAIVQISTLTSVLITQLMNLNYFPLHLQQLISDPLYIKVGVGILDDLEKLKKDFDIEYNSFIDLSLSYVRHYKNEIRSLSKILNQLFNISLDKPKYVQLSNWENEYLTQKQIVYAAYDAISASLIYDKLLKENAYKEVNIINYLDALVNPLNRSGREAFRGVYNITYESNIFLHYIGIKFIELENLNIIKPYDSSVDYTVYLINHLSRLAWILRFKSNTVNSLNYCQVVIDNHIIGEFTGEHKRTVRNTLCYNILNELAVIQGNINPHSIIRDYAGKGSIPIEYIHYINKKPLEDTVNIASVNSNIVTSDSLNLNNCVHF